MTQHTEGEWHVGNDNESIRGEDGKSIAKVFQHSVMAVDIARMDANARLIAAAPKMLAALEIANAQLRNLRDSLYDEGKAKIRAAIAAAKGE